MKSIQLVSAILITIVSQNAFALSPSNLQHPSICGTDDSRVPSKLKPIARMMASATDDGGCTGTLISKSCMISAGHCTDYLNVAQFNVPLSKKTGHVAYPGAMDQYPLDRVIASHEGDGGVDWSVYLMKPNPITGKAAGDVQGFYKFNSNPFAAAGQTLRITGYGSDDQKTRNYAQQTATGTLAGITGTQLQYVLDTMPGNSGSAVIMESTQEIIGIHTNGGCSASGGQNTGTALANSITLQQAIEQCLSMNQ